MDEEGGRWTSAGASKVGGNGESPSGERDRRRKKERRKKGCTCYVCPPVAPSGLARLSRLSGHTA
jgi:hypothetical protein